MNDRNMKEASFHDFMVERKWLVTTMGFGPLKGWRHSMYLAAIFTFFFYLFVTNFYGAILASGEKSLIPHALHVLIIIIFGSWGLATRVSADKALDRIRKYIESGFYTYEGERFLEEQVRIKESVVQEIRNKSRDFVAVWLLAAVTICVFFPITQFFMVPEEEYEKVVDIANPYLPAFFYMPFSTRNPWGFTAAYLIGFVAYFYIIGYGMLLNEFYLSIIVQLRAQLQILNYSISHIHTRAIQMNASLKDVPLEDKSLDDVYQDSDYQKCLMKCLRSNIQHHQLLLRFNKEFFKFSGSILLLVFNIAAIVFALNVYIITQNPALNVSIKCFITFLAEQMFALYYCAFGEIIMNESRSLFTSLYSVPWYYYSKAFNRDLQVFMCYTMRPMRIKALVIDLTASLETFANSFYSKHPVLECYSNPWTNTSLPL